MKTKDIVKKVTDAVTIFFLAAIGIAATFGAVNAVETIELVKGVVLAVLGYTSSVASIIYNIIAKPEKAAG